MRYKLEKPALTSNDIANINFLCHYMRWVFNFIPERRYVIETGSDIGYIQVDENERPFIVWKSTESVDYVSHWLNNVFNISNFISLKGKAKTKAKEVLNMFVKDISYYGSHV